MSWKVHETDEVFAALRGLCSNSYRMYDPCEHRYYYDHECDAYECVVEDAAKEYQRLLRHCNHQREQLALYEEGGRTMNERTTNDERESGAGITDELRKYADELDMIAAMKSEHGMSPVAIRLKSIADRIDKEHAKAVERARMDGMDATFGNGWVKLPVDAEGVPVKLGDTVRLDSTVIEVIGIGNVTSDMDDYGVFCQRDDGRYEWFNARFLRHVKPDSWERIIRDAIAEGFERTDVSAPCEVGNNVLVERCRRLADGC